MFSRYYVYYPDRDSPNGLRKAGDSLLDLPNGGVYDVILKQNVSENQPWERFNIVEPSSMSVFYQLPQIIVLTIGEVLFSVSGLAFAYSQVNTPQLISM